jgi:hypothetical protein
MKADSACWFMGAVRRGMEVAGEYASGVIRTRRAAFRTGAVAFGT